MRSRNQPRGGGGSSGSEKPKSIVKGERRRFRKGKSETEGLVGRREKMRNQNKTGGERGGGRERENQRIKIPTERANELTKYHHHPFPLLVVKWERERARGDDNLKMHRLNERFRSHKKTNRKCDRHPDNKHTYTGIYVVAAFTCISIYIYICSSEVDTNREREKKIVRWKLDGISNSGRKYEIEKRVYVFMYNICIEI